MSQYMGKLRNIARHHCANWNVGKCLGCVLKEIDDRVVQVVDSELAGKDCIVEEGCSYFDEFVIPGITDERQRREAAISKRVS